MPYAFLNTFSLSLFESSYINYLKKQTFTLNFSLQAQVLAEVSHLDCLLQMLRPNYFSYPIWIFLLLFLSVDILEKLDSPLEILKPSRAIVKHWKNPSILVIGRMYDFTTIDLGYIFLMRTFFNGQNFSDLLYIMDIFYQHMNKNNWNILKVA